MSEAGERNELFLFCDSQKKHPGKRIPVARLVRTTSGWMERGPGDLLFRPGVEFMTSTGMRGRFSPRPGRSPFFPCPRCRFTVSARENKLHAALDEALAEARRIGVFETSLSDLSLRIEAVGK